MFMISGVSRVPLDLWGTLYDGMPLGPVVQRYVVLVTGQDQVVQGYVSNSLSCRQVH
jgi:hypothetical protein